MGNITLEGCLGSASSSVDDDEKSKRKKIRKAPVRSETSAPSSSSSYWEHVTDDSEHGGFSLSQFRILAQRKGGIPDRYRGRLWSATTCKVRRKLARVNKLAQVAVDGTKSEKKIKSMWDANAYDKLYKIAAGPSANMWNILVAIPTEAERSRIIKEQLLVPATATRTNDSDKLTNEQIKEWSKTMKQLHCDMPRNSLITGNVTKQRLVALCVAASVHNPKAGYMQGMDALACTLLQHLNDEDAFWSYMILTNYTLKGYFDDPQNHAAMTFELWVFQELLKEQLPHINDVLTSTFDSLFSAMNIPLNYEGSFS